MAMRFASLLWFCPVVVHTLTKPEDVYYSSYLELPQLLQLNNPLTEEHDEQWFITIHQVSELYFKQILLEFASIRSHLSTYQQQEDTTHLEEVCHLAYRVVQILRLLGVQVDVLRSTMKPTSFAKFRNALGSASGYQSWQFRQIEFTLGLPISKRALHSLQHNDKQQVELCATEQNLRIILEQIFQRVTAGTDMDQVTKNLTQLVSLYNQNQSDSKIGYDMCVLSNKAAALALYAYSNKGNSLYSPLADLVSVFAEIDMALTQFRKTHLALAQDQIGQQSGTGGSIGVPYLEKQVATQVAFPEFQIIKEYAHLLRSQPSSALHETVDFVSIGLARHLDEIAITFPTDVAVIEDIGNGVGRSIGYAMLHNQSRILANQLLESIVTINGAARIGIYCKRSMELVVAELAVLKAGLCFVPLGLTWPKARIKHVMQDSDVALVISDTSTYRDALLLSSATPPVHLVFHLPDNSKTVELYLHHINSSLANAQRNTSSTTHQSYIIYTSGTTGAPKGVVISDVAMSIGIYSLLKLVPLQHGQKYVTILTTQHIFDFSLAQIFCPLAAGGSLVITKDNGEQNAAYMAALFTRYGVSVQALLPSLARAIWDVGEDLGEQLTHIVVGGDVFPTALARDMFQSLEKFRRFAVSIHNGYGPTENGIGACAFTMTSSKDISKFEASSLPITRVHGIFPYRSFDIVNSETGEIATDGKGELVICGRSLADGYHNNEIQTNAKFRLHPLHSRQRCYWTGDIVEADKHGLMFFFGRVDGQVKVRGFRVELPEIEHVARTHSEVVDAVATLSVSGAMLFLYIMVKVASDRPIVQRQVRTLCANRLPAHSCPTAIIVLHDFPLTVNGKLNKSVLPRPTREDFGFDPASGDCEYSDGPPLQMFLAIVKEIVGFEVLPCDSWTNLGIDSQTTNVIMNKARNQGLCLPYEDLHCSSQLASIFASIVVESSCDDVSFDILDVEQALQIMHIVLPTQHAMLDATARGGKGKQMVQLVVKLDNAPMNHTKMKIAVEHVIKHHAGLRMTFHQVDGEWRQKVWPAQELQREKEWVQVEIDTHADIEQFLKADKLRGFLLGESHEPLLRLAVGQEHLVLSVHHAVLDGASADLLLKQVMEFYAMPDSGGLPILRPYSSVLDYLAKVAQGRFRPPHAIDEANYEYLDKQFSFDLDHAFEQARANKVTIATQLLWLCRQAIPDRTMGIIVSGRDVSRISDVSNIMGMLVDYAKLPVNISSIKDLEKQMLKLRFRPHESVTGGFDVLVNVKYSDSGPGYRLVRVEETLGFPLSFEFFISGHLCKLHVQYASTEARSALHVTKQFMPKLIDL